MDSDTGEPRLIELSPGVYAWEQPDGSWWINNAGAVHGADGVVLIDTCATAERTQRFLAALHQATGGADVRVAVNTHFHGDHAYGNVVLPASTVLIGHPATRAALLADTILTATPPIWSPSPAWGVAVTRPPTITVSDRLTIFTGESAVELHHPGYPAHTVGDLIAWLPDAGVLFAGDLIFHQVTPLVLMGSLDGALRSLDWVNDFGARTIVPGHGQVVTAAIDTVLDQLASYYRLVLETARDGLCSDLTPLEAARRCPLGPFAGWPDQERLVLNLHRAYADATGATMDLTAAFIDAIAYNGGPLHCAV